LFSLDNQQQLDFMEIIEDRHARKATIIASQLPVANWFDLFKEETLADAILDRIVHTSHRFELKGESLRKKQYFCRTFIEIIHSQKVGGYDRNGWAGITEICTGAHYQCLATNKPIFYLAIENYWDFF
jgi:hypothetical protein